MRTCPSQLSSDGASASDARWHFKNLEVIGLTDDQLGKFTNLLLSYIHPNLQDCQLNLQNLIKLELEFDEDYKISPSKFSYKKLRRKRKSLRKRL